MSARRAPGDETQGAEQRLRALLTEVTGRDASHVLVDTDLVDELGLDSLAGLRVLAAFEKRFGVRLPDEQLSTFRTLRSLLASLPSSPRAERGAE